MSRFSSGTVESHSIYGKPASPLNSRWFGRIILNEKRGTYGPALGAMADGIHSSEKTGIMHFLLRRLRRPREPGSVPRGALSGHDEPLPLHERPPDGRPAKAYLRPRCALRGRDPGNLLLRRRLQK